MDILLMLFDRPRMPMSGVNVRLLAKGQKRREKIVGRLRRGWKGSCSSVRFKNAAATRKEDRQKSSAEREERWY